MQIVSLIFKAILIIVCGYGIIENIIPAYFYKFNYYTVLSNTAVFIYFAGSFIWGLRQLYHRNSKTTWRPKLLMSVTYAIIITFLIYTLLLAGADIASGKFLTVHNIIVHYIVPIMTLMYFIIFCPKEKLWRFTPFLWLQIPFIYFMYILIRAKFFGNIGTLGTPYPYGFIDITKHGWENVSVTIVFILSGLLVLGYLFYFINGYFARKDEFKKIKSV